MILTVLYRVQSSDIDCVEANPLVYVSAQEWERAQRIKHEQARHTTLLGRVLARQVLSAKLNCLAAEVPIIKNEYGKPQVEAGVWHFNISHSGPHILVGVSQGCAIGVDIQEQKIRGRLAELAQFIMHPEEWRKFQSLDEQAAEAYFYKVWALKEAYVKWDGRGIQVGLKSVHIDDLAPKVVVAADVNLQYLSAPEGYVAALCVNHVQPQVQELRWQSVFE